MVDAALERELDEIFAARDRDDMAPTVAAFLDVLARHPDDARVSYEVGGSYDTAGDEATALVHYERALSLGLEGDLLRRCLLQYGSTLRNLERYEESLAVFARARRTFPGSVSLGVFEAITLHASGRPDRALAGLLELVADAVDSDELDRYKPAVRGNAAYIRSLDPA